MCLAQQVIPSSYCYLLHHSRLPANSATLARPEIAILVSAENSLMFSARIKAICKNINSIKKSNSISSSSSGNNTLLVAEATEVEEVEDIVAAAIAITANMV